MAPLVQRLDSAAAALARDDAAAALAEIIAAWQAQHHPRIANIAARISSLAAAGRTAIAGKTVKLRLAAWLEAEKDHDLVDVERLLADPWPKQWRDGSVRFERIASWGPDPRVAALLIRTFTDPPYESQASHGLQRQMLRHLVLLEDPRSREIVQEKVTDLARLYDRARAMGGELPDILAKLERIEQLEPDAEARVAALEARFAGTARAEIATKKTAAELLEAIYADPSDTAAKTVFADWLTENGDPRGELITLGIARGIARRSASAGPAKEAERRERALTEKIADDHAAWDWPVARHFKRGTRRYEEGFFAGGQLERRENPEIEHPAWSHVRAIELEWPEPWDRSVGFAFLARLPALRELTNVGADDVLPVLETGALRQLERLEIVEVLRDGAPALDARHPFAATTALPALKTLGVACTRWHASAVASLPSWPIVRRVERLMLRNTDGQIDVHEVFADLASVPGPKTIEVRPDRWADRRADAEVVYRVERTEPVGPFRRLAVRATYGDIVHLLESFPPASLDFIAMDPKRTKLRPSEQPRLRAALARFPGATVDPPLDGPSDETPPRKTKPEVVALLSLGMDGANLHLPEEIGRVVRHVSKLGITFDYYSLGHGNQQRPLVPDPVKKAEAMTRADKRITLHADGTESQVTLGSHGHDHLALELGREELAGALDWAIALIEDRVDRLRRVTIEIEPRPPVGGARGFEAQDRATVNPFGLWWHVGAYAVLLDGEWTERLTLPRWQKHLPGEPALAGMFFRDVGITSKRRLVGLHADPLVAPTLAEHQALTRVVHRMVADIMEETHGYRWRELADATLGPALAELGLDGTTRLQALGVGVDHGSADGRRRLTLRLRSPFDAAPEIIAALECHPEGTGWFTNELARGHVATRAEASSLLERTAASALAARTWFDDPRPKEKARRR